MVSRAEIVALVALLACVLPNDARAETGADRPQPTVLFENVRIFDGERDRLPFGGVQRARERQHHREDLD